MCPELGYQNDVAGVLPEPSSGPGADEHRKGEIKQCQGLRQGNGAWQQSWTCLFTGSDLLAIVPGSDEQKFLLVQRFQDGD